MKIYGDSVIGNVRPQNEDSVLVHDIARPCFAAVADGMGGAAAGEIASVTAVLSLQKYILDSKKEKISKKLLAEAENYANRNIISKADTDSGLKGMGSTLTFAYYTKKAVLIAQIGDSAAYIFSGGKLKKITKDHSYVQQLVDKGRITPLQAKTAPYRNIITRAMGMSGVTADYYSISWGKGDVIMLCSDGLGGSFDEDTVCGILADAAADIKEKTEALINHALALGSRDNISVVLAENSDDAEVAL